MITKFKLFEKRIDVEYHCHECDWKGWIPMSKIVTCPNCGNINDVWKEGEPEPERHVKMNESIDGYEIVDVKDMINKYAMNDDDMYIINRKLIDIFIGKTCKFVGWRHDDNVYEEQEINGEIKSARFNYYDDPEIDGEIIFTVSDIDYNVVRKNVYILVDPKKLQKNDDDPYNEEDWDENKVDDFRKIYGEKISVI